MSQETCGAGKGGWRVSLRDAGGRSQAKLHNAYQTPLVTSQSFHHPSPLARSVSSFANELVGPAQLIEDFPARNFELLELLSGCRVRIGSSVFE